MSHLLVTLFEQEDYLSIRPQFSKAKGSHPMPPSCFTRDLKGVDFICNPVENNARIILFSSMRFNLLSFLFFSLCSHYHEVSTVSRALSS